MEEKKKMNLNVYKITNPSALTEAESKYRDYENGYEHMPWANTGYMEIASHIITDKHGSFSAPLFLSVSVHKSTHGIKNIC